MEVIVRNNIRYIVKPEDKIVIGFMSYDPWYEIEDNPGGRLSYDLRRAMDSILNDKCEHYQTVHLKAIARCAPEDEFDAEYGMKLVEARLWKKYHEHKMTDYWNIINGITKISDEINKEYEKHIKKTIRIKGDLKNYFGKE